MAIYVIRHGETALNAARIVQPPDTPLSQRGIAQAECVARRLATVGITHILSSNQQRALRTAEIIQQATGASLRIEPLLQERNYGDIRGRAYADLGVDILSPEYEPPGGETWAEFYARVASLWPLITAAAHDASGSLAVVTHGLVCHALAAHHLSFSEGMQPPSRWGNTSVTVIGSQPPWRVEVVNCTAHLDGLSADDQRTLSGA